MRLYQPLVPPRAPEQERYLLSLKLRQLYILRVLKGIRAERLKTELELPRAPLSEEAKAARQKEFDIAVAESKLLKLWFCHEVRSTFPALVDETDFRLSNGWFVESAKYHPNSTRAEA
jgi:hypothetical protein